MTDEFAISFPMGVVFQKNSRLPIDVAVVPTLLHTHRVVFAIGVNTFHGIGHEFAAGIGMFVNVSNRSWGFAPALDKVLLHMGGGRALVGDIFLPVQFDKHGHGVGVASVGVAMHVGIAF